MNIILFSNTQKTPYISYKDKESLGKNKDTATFSQQSQTVFIFPCVRLPPI